MPNAIQWQAAWTDRGNVLTTELNSLANAARSAPGTELANQTNLDQYGQLEVSVTFAVAPSAGGFLQIHMVTAPDGTNYQDGAAADDPGFQTVVAVIPLRAVTTAQRVMSPIFTLYPAKTKFLLFNSSGQAFPATGSTVKLYTNNDEIQ